MQPTHQTELALTNTTLSEVETRLSVLDIDALTPRQALEQLYQLKALISS